MSLSTQVLDMAGNLEYLDGVQVSYDSMTNTVTPVANRPAVCAGTGAPTFNAPKGSLYLRLDGSSTATRAYIATNATGTWTAVTTAA